MQRDDGVVRTAEVVVDRVEPVDLPAAVALEVDETLGDVGTADRQPGFLERVGIPARARADLQDMSRGERLGQPREPAGQDTAARRSRSA